MEVPLVTFGVGGIGEHVREDGEDMASVGLRVHDPAPGAIANATAWLLRHPKVAAEMGRRGRQRVVQHFTVERMVRSYDKFYSTAVDKAQRA